MWKDAKARVGQSRQDQCTSPQPQGEFTAKGMEEQAGVRWSDSLFLSQGGHRAILTETLGLLSTLG